MLPGKYGCPAITITEDRRNKFDKKFDEDYFAEKIKI